MNNYQKRITDRDPIQFTLGAIRRIPKWVKFGYSNIILRLRRVMVGKDVTVHPSSLCYQNVTIGDNVSIAKNFVVSNRTRKVHIGNNVIIGDNVKLLTESHDIESPAWENIRRETPLIIDDFAWICPYATILPSVSKIGKGAVVGSCSVVTRDVGDFEVVGGNPAVCLKKRKCVHSKLQINSLMGNDFITYIRTWLHK